MGKAFDKWLFSEKDVVQIEICIHIINNQLNKQKPAQDPPLFLSFLSHLYLLPPFYFSEIQPPRVI